MDDRHRQLAELLTTIGPRLHALLCRLTLRDDIAEELMQTLFVNLSQSRAFRKADDPAAYTCRAAMNLAFTWRRLQRFTKLAAALEGAPAASKNHSPLAKMAADEELQRVLDAVATLPDLQRDVIVMRFIQGESDETIARHVGRPAHHVHALRHRAIAALRRTLGGSNPRPSVKGVLYADYR